jgi:hypothetical protein
VFMCAHKQSVYPSHSGAVFFRRVGWLWRLLALVVVVVCVVSCSTNYEKKKEEREELCLVGCEFSGFT